MLYKRCMFHLTDNPAKGRKIIIFHPNSHQVLDHAETSQEAVERIDQLYRDNGWLESGQTEIRRNGKKWRTKFYLRGERKTFGYFESLADAMKAVDEARIPFYDFDLVNTFLQWEKKERLQKQEVKNVG